MAALDYSTTPASNTTISSINIDEGCDPGNINNAIRQMMADIRQIVTPVGTVNDYAGSSEPDGWLFCDGSAISRTTYSALFTAIGTTYGSGDGSTTFNLPDYEGRVGVGRDDMSGSAAGRVESGDAPGIDGTSLGAAGGVSEHTLTGAEMQHKHGTGNLAMGGPSGTSEVASGSGSTVASDGHSHTISNDTGTTKTVTATAHTNMQPSIIINKIIFTGVFS